MKERYHISGMTCSACSSHVQKAAGTLDGVESASVNLLTETMEIIYDENLLTSAEIIAAVEKAGYGAASMTGADKNKEQDKSKESLKRKQEQDEKSMRWRLLLSVFFLLPLMYVAMFLQMNSGPENAMTFAMTQLLLLLPILYLNRKFFAVGFKTLMHLQPNMDSLIALGASAALGYGIFAMYRISYGLGHGETALVHQYSHDLYFESAGMILTLITVGKYLEGRSKGKTSEAIEKLMDLSPKMATVIDENGAEREIPTSEVKKGDLFVVKPGSLVPVDGTIVEGYSGVDESAITGESIPVEKRTGDKVISATMNKAGFLKCRADRVGEDTTLSQIIRLVEEASASKAPIARLADKVAGVFVPVVMGIALFTFIGWLLAGQTMEFAISTAIAVLVISCPCALGLATPVAIMVGTGIGAKHGVLIKSGEALQTARSIDTVVLDKTGTITEGKLRVMGVYGYEKGISTEKLLSVAAALEKMSEHPLADAVIKEAESFNVILPKVTNFQAVFGRGVQGVPTDGCFAGNTVFVGNQAYLQENGLLISEAQRELEAQIAGQGETPLWIAVAEEESKRAVGLMALADEIKPSSYKAVKAFKKLGIRMVMLTGDNEKTAVSVKERLGIEEVIAQVLPQDKEHHIRLLQKQGRKVAMIGDGINDAPALAAADVGMAIGAGTDVAMESADIVLMKNDLCDAVTAVSLSKAVIRNIKQNLFWAFFYNSIGIPLAAGLLYPAFGLKLSPMFGAAAMSMSSIFVVGNALRLRRFRGMIRLSEKKSEAAGSIADRVEKEDSMKKVITIEGMMCGHCTGRVQKALESIGGVAQVTMSLENKTATVELSEAIDEEVLKAAITEAGYEVIAIEE